MGEISPAMITKLKDITVENAMIQLFHYAHVQQESYLKKCLGSKRVSIEQQHANGSTKLGSESYLSVSHMLFDR